MRVPDEGQESRGNSEAVKRDVPVLEPRAPRRRWLEYAALAAAMMLAGAVGFYDGQQEEQLLPTEGGLPVAPAVFEAVTPIPAPVFPGPPPETRSGPRVELTVYLLRGSDSEAFNEQLPPDWDSTLRQVRTRFPFKNYRRMHTQVLMARSGGKAEATANVSGMNLAFSVSPTVTPGTAPRKLRLTGFQVRLQTQDENIRLVTELDAEEGQKTVVGETNLGGDPFIVVVSPTVIE